MPTYDYICEVCGRPGRAWRIEGHPPRFCNKDCKSKGLAGQSRRNARYIITPAMHDAIRKVYQDMTGAGEVNALARRLGIPRWKVTHYAIAQGWIPRHRKEPDWSEPELHVLELHAHLTPENIQKYLRKAGYSRSVFGIVLKRKRMRFVNNLSGQSATSLALCFGVDVKGITRWILNGWLKAAKRGTNRTEAQGGDQWYIKDQDVRQFILNYMEEIDLRKVDKYWFIDMLARGGPGRVQETFTDAATA